MNKHVVNIALAANILRHTHSAISDEVYAAAREMERLEAIVGKLKKTADRVPVVPHSDTRLWYIHPKTGKIYERTYEADLDDTRCHRDRKGGVVWVSVEESYSTREAAEAAKRERDERTH